MEKCPAKAKPKQVLKGNIQNRGELKQTADGSTDDVASIAAGGQMIQVEFAPGTVAPRREDLHHAVSNITGVQQVHNRVSTTPEHHVFEVVADRDIRTDLYQLSSHQGVVLLEMARGASSLEEVFRRLTDD